MLRKAVVVLPKTRSLVALRLDHDDVTTEARCSRLVKTFISSNKRDQIVVSANGCSSHSRLNKILKLADIFKISAAARILRLPIRQPGVLNNLAGLCSCRVRGVDGSCAKHLTAESYTVIYAANSHTYYY